MKSPRIIVLLFASTVVASLSAAQTLEWHSIENLSPNTRIWVKTKKQTYCYFEKATGEQLLCDFLPDLYPQKRMPQIWSSIVRMFARCESRLVTITILQRDFSA